MFFAENEYGSERLKQAYETLPINRADKLKKVSKFLDVSERTLSAWLIGKSNPPRAVVYAIWHESPIGRAVTAAHSEQAAHLWRTFAKSQESHVKKMESKIDILNAEIDTLKRINQSAERFPVAVNEPFFTRY